MRSFYKFTFCALVAIAATAVCDSHRASAQTAGAAQAPKTFHRVALVDVAYIFKNHDLIKKEIESVQSQTDQFQEQFNAKREEMKTAVDQLKSFRAGSPEFAAQEEMIAGLDSQLRLQMTRKRKELADAEAKIYYDNYQLITQSVKAIAEFYKYDLVLRYNSEKMDPAEGATVIRGVMKSVIYQAPNMDMTKGVMEYLTRLKTNVARK